MASNGLLDPQLLQQTHKIQPQQHEQKQFSGLESEPDTPVPTSINTAPPALPSLPAHDTAADKVTQRSPPLIPPIDTTNLPDSFASLHVPSNESGSVSGSSVLAEEQMSSSPSTLYPSYAANLHELSAASLQFFPTFSTSPAKLDHIQSLVSTLHKTMEDQSFAMGDLRNQLDEIQIVLNRVSPKKNNMTTEEREILQNAQMMKDLAEEVVSSDATSQPGANIDKQEVLTENSQSRTTLSLTLTMPSPQERLVEPTETPPTTATTPPPGPVFQQGYLRHRSSTASFASSANSDRQQYTQDGTDEQRPSRPSSVASSYHRQQRKKTRQSLRQLEPMNKRNSQQDRESNAAFDRICSLLTEMITDASTAVSTAPDGTQQASNIPIPQFVPIVPSDSELSADSDSDEEEEEEEVDGSNSVGGGEGGGGGEGEDVTERKEIEDPFLKRLQGPDNVPSTDEEGEPEVELEQPTVDKYRTGFRSHLDKSSTKRHSSLFMELHNTPVIQGAAMNEHGRRRQLSDVSHLDREAFIKERVMRRPRHSFSSMSVPSSARPSRPSSMYLLSSTSTSKPTTTGNAIEGQDSGDSGPESLLLVGGRRLRHRDSISSLRSEPVVRRSTMDNNHESHPQYHHRTIKRDDMELNRTVETMDGLARDLVAVAAHQNLMQMRLQKTLQFQKERIQQIERAHSLTDIVTTTSMPGQQQQQQQQQQQNPLADLSMSLKQVAVSVGKVIASSTKHPRHPSTVGGQRQEEGKEKERENEEQNNVRKQGLWQRSTSRFSSKDFSRYFQELEKVAALGGKFAFGKDDVVGVESEVILEEAPLDLQEEEQSQGSYTFINLPKHSCRNSTATLVDDELAFSLEDQPKVTYHQHDDYGMNSAQDIKSPATAVVTRSRQGSDAYAPPDLEDFAAQCQLLTKALVLPFLQLTHHAMTSEDSALALNPRSSRQDQDLDSTLRMMENLEFTTDTRSLFKSSDLHTPGSTNRSSRSGSPMRSSATSRGAQQAESSHLSSPSSSSSSSAPWADRELDSMPKKGQGQTQGDLSSDVVMVKAKAFFSTGLYLLHLLYWTVLFVVGTIVLDPWLAENAGQQVVRIVDQVRDVVGKDEQRHQLHYWRKNGSINSDQSESGANGATGVRVLPSIKMAPSRFDIRARRRS
ncbi:hypothetical protein BGZ65_004955, partial [Modicella reniformis]